MVDGATPLFIAAQNGHLAMMKFLLEHGADANAPRKVGLSLELSHMLSTTSLVLHRIDPPTTEHPKNYCCSACVVFKSAEIETTHFVFEYLLKQIQATSCATPNVLFWRSCPIDGGYWLLVRRAHA